VYEHQVLTERDSKFSGDLGAREVSHLIRLRFLIMTLDGRHEPSH